MGTGFLKRAGMQGIMVERRTRRRRGVDATLEVMLEAVSTDYVDYL